MNNIENNLIYLDIHFSSVMKINSDLFENINKFKLLKYLYINSFNFNTNFIITLNDLKLLSIKYSKNILISKKN